MTKLTLEEIRAELTPDEQEVFDDLVGAKEILTMEKDDPTDVADALKWIDVKIGTHESLALAQRQVREMKGLLVKPISDEMKFAALEFDGDETRITFILKNRRYSLVEYHNWLIEIAALLGKEE